MPKILQDYIIFLREMNYSEQTINIYCSTIKEFLDFIANYYNIIGEVNIFFLRQVKTYDIDAFLVYLNNEKNNESSTRNRKVTTIRMFFKYLVKQYPNYLLTNPVEKIYIQKTQKFPKYLSQKQAKKLIGVFNMNNSRYPEKNNLIIYLLLTTGMRRAEIRNIDIKNINLENKTINVIGKGNKERIIYLPESTTMQIKTFIQGKDITCPLFTYAQNKRLSCRAINEIVNKAIKLAGINGKYSTHSLRHTYATLMYEKGTDILVVKELLGHQSVASTQIYTHLSSNYMRNIMDKNPLNRVGGIKNE